jgi:phosphatidylglycerophosphate synthase
MSQNKSKIESTLKSKETEEFLDVIFYRPLGYLMAVASKKMGITPNCITIFSIFVGVLAGHLFYYNDLTINIVGIALLIWAEALDSADGQLARMTDTKSLYGRILDGFGGNLWFISIYIHLCLRLINTGESYTIFIVAVVCGISHSLQSAIADYYRNYYLFFVYGKSRSEISKSQNLKKEYQELSWRRNFAKKFLMRVYVNYTYEQEFLSAKSVRLLGYISSINGEQAPAKVSDEFRKKNKSLIKYYNILTTNTRMIVLFISILTGYLPLYFIFEATILNFLLAYVVYKHEMNAETILFKTIIINMGETCIKEQ